MLLDVLGIESVEPVVAPWVVGDGRLAVAAVGAPILIDADRAWIDKERNAFVMQLKLQRVRMGVAGDDQVVFSLAASYEGGASQEALP